jgi:hypothetical protein
MSVDDALSRARRRSAGRLTGAWLGLRRSPRRMLTILGWSPTARCLLSGSRLPCGCAIGTYETWSGVIVTVVDHHAGQCVTGHRAGDVLDGWAEDSHGAAATAVLECGRCGEVFRSRHDRDVSRNARTRCPRCHASGEFRVIAPDPSGDLDPADRPDPFSSA